MTTGTTTVNTPMGVTHPKLWMNLATELNTTNRLVTNTAGVPVAVVYGPRPTTRRSRLVFLYDDEQEARRCEEYHAYGGLCTVTEPDRPTHSMAYIPTGQIVRTLAPETAADWIVEVDVTEIPLYS